MSQKSDLAKGWLRQAENFEMLRRVEGYLCDCQQCDLMQARADTLRRCAKQLDLGGSRCKY